MTQLDLLLPRDTHVTEPSEVRRLSGQNLAILQRLQQGPVSNGELAGLSLKYTSRISDLRAAGYVVRCERAYGPKGLTIYTLAISSRAHRAGAGHEIKPKMTLYHYCCSCSARKITARGFLIPHGRELFGVNLVWLTDQVVPHRTGLGLTSTILKCDRLEYQYRVECDPADVTRWLDSDVRRTLVREDGFEAFEDGREPETWWIATRPVFAIRNRKYQRPRDGHRPASVVCVLP